MPSQSRTVSPGPDGRSVRTENGQVLRVPDELTERLARYDEDVLEEIVLELAATEDFELSDLPVEDIQSFMDEFAELARKADAEEKSLFIWMHPLLT